MSQLSLPGLCPVTDALEQLRAAGLEQRGAVFTRPEVVDFILDLVGYTPDRPLHEMRLLEPAAGEGDFLLPAVRRLLAAYRRHCRSTDIVSDLGGCIRAVELHRTSLDSARAKLLALLEAEDLSGAQSTALADAWLMQGDFLLTSLPDSFSHIVGNPPYVRQELVPDALMAEYRQRFQTIFDRADLYIPFIEKSLSHLGPDGTLGFICADRWMKNRYGGPLRQLVAKRFYLKVYVDMTGTPAFHTDVMAYPAITVIARERPGPTRIASRPIIQADFLSTLAQDLLRPESPAPDSPVREAADIVRGAEPWVFESCARIALVRRLEQSFPTVEQAGCRVGIGVATGADKQFIGRYDELDVEPDRKLPLVMTRDILAGQVRWRGYGVINPFNPDGTLVDLKAHPRLARYLEIRKDAIGKRHVARRNPQRWYRTIDRIYPELALTPKLLIPDIKGEPLIVYERGGFYPHHNLYFITSREWDLQALQAVLLSGIARLFISVYSTRLRGGYLRFQAQYLRRIRLPRWQDVPEGIKAGLMAAAGRRDIAACNTAVFDLYSLSLDEQTLLAEQGS